MHALRTPTTLLALASLLTACGADDGGALDLEAVGRARVEVCHVTGSGVNIIEVSSSATGAHLGHGDVLVDTWYVDADGDGYGEGAASDCPDDADPTGWTTLDGDCDDGDALASPDEEEVCGDGLDNNCDGQIDEDCVVEPVDCPCFDAETLQGVVDDYYGAEDVFFSLGGYWFGGASGATFGTSGGAGGNGYLVFQAPLYGGVPVAQLAGVDIVDNGTARVRYGDRLGTSSCELRTNSSVYDAAGTRSRDSVHVSESGISIAEGEACMDVIAQVLDDNGL